MIRVLFWKSHYDKREEPMRKVKTRILKTLLRDVSSDCSEKGDNSTEGNGSEEEKGEG